MHFPCCLQPGRHVSAVSVEDTDRKNCYSQLLPYGHPAITDTQIIRTALKSRAKINYGRLTEINSHCNGRARQHKILSYSVTKRLKSITNFQIRGPKTIFCHLAFLQTARVNPFPREVNTKVSFFCAFCGFLWHQLRRFRFMRCTQVDANST